MPRKANSKVRKGTDSGTNDSRIAKFTQLICDGENQYQAAIAAGYSDSTARNAYRELMPRAQDVFRRALAQHAPIGKQAKKIAEGMEATETVFFQKDGKVTDSRDVVAWGARHKYLELAAKCQGFLVDNVQLSGKDGEQLVIEVRRMGTK